MSILFINGSPEANGNTAALAKDLIGNLDYQQLNLGEYKLYDYGTHFADDQFNEVLEQILAADTLVIGSPVYWHDLSGMLRCLLDRFYGTVAEDSMSDKRLFFVYQGAAPTPDMIHRGEYTISRFAGLYGMTYAGMANTHSQARQLHEKL